MSRDSFDWNIDRLLSECQLEIVLGPLVLAILESLWGHLGSWTHPVSCWGHGIDLESYGLTGDVLGLRANVWSESGSFVEVV